MKTLAILVVLLISSVCFADQTIYCPQDPNELGRQCAQAGERFRELEGTIQNMESITNNFQMMLVKVQVPQNQNSFTVGNVNYPVRARFQSQGALYIPLTQLECSQIFGSIYYNNRAEYERQMSAVRSNTMTMKQGIWQRLQEARREHQHYTLFRAQCCGYRWTNDVGVPSENQPTQPSYGPGLLGVVPNAVGR